MKTDIRLFIGGKEIEFTADPKILFNYKLTDINNPTVVKNSYSKSIEIEGTPKNNDVFENIWNLQRVQWGGINFNPIKKTDFTIYVNGDIYERGYAKLDGITTKNRKITYSITLFGGLGSFFFNLSYKDSEGDDKKSLADLYYAKRDIGNVFQQSEPDLNFRINKDTLWDAWNVITGNPDAVYDESEVNRPDNYYYDRKWEILNFAPCYNGLPDDFDADKCIINKKNMPVLTFSKTDNGKTFTDYRGYAMGEQPNDELTEWETFDLRSYLQRPVVSMRRVIDACCNPVNNGGYEVDLDSTFFSYDNPYYTDAYLTLPMLRENIEGGETVISSDGQLVEMPLTDSYKDYTKLYKVDYNIDTISKIVNVELGLNLELSTTGTANQLYLYRKFKASPDYNSNMERVKTLESIGSIYVQLAAFDALGNCVASSNVYFVTDAKASGKTKFNELYWKKHSAWGKTIHTGGTGSQGAGGHVISVSAVPVPGVTNVYGSFMRNSSGKYELVDGNGNPIILNFTFATETPYSRLEMTYISFTDYNYEFYNPYKWWKGREYNSVKTGKSTSPLKFYLNDGINYGGNISIESAKNRNSYDVSPAMDIENFELITKDYSEFFSNTYVRKQDILNTEKTPAEYLISYAKMFGLYFYYDPSEEAEDSSLAPNGVIHLMTRDTYYTGEVVDLEEFINRDKGIKITPTTLDSKWINFNVEQVESEANKEHKDKFGYDYGYQKVNTGYNFNADNKAILDKVVYKGGVEALETSKYYQVPIEGYPAYGDNGFIYTLFYGIGDDMETLEVDDKFSGIYRNSINPNEWYDTDAFKKPQFHEKDNEATDGKDVLLFYTGEKWYSDSFNYWITDDIEEMLALNDGKPCWIMTVDKDDVNGNRIAYPINLLPIFQRNLVYSGNGTIKHSWDFGNPFITFVRDMYAGEQSGLYFKCWKNYIGDLYSEDNRILNTYVVFKEAPNAGALRKFYWFDNCLWRMNAIKDWNVAGYESTAVEFIKVIDEENYKLTPITNTIIASFTFPNLLNVDDEFGGDERDHYYRISADAQDVTGVINVGNAGSWSFGDGAGASCIVTWTDGTSESYLYSDIMEPSNDYGSGDAIKVFSLTANTKSIERTWYFNILDNDDRGYKVHIIQSGMTADVEPQFTLSPSTVFFDAGGGQQTVLLGNSNIDSYTVGNLPNWVSLLNVRDVGFTLQAQPNSAGVIKNAAISVTGHKTGYSDLTKYLQISQNIYSGSVSFDKSTVYVGNNINDTSEQVNITWNNITERAFGVKPSDRFRFNLIDGTNAFTITALKANTQSTPITGSFEIICKDTNGNTITKSITIVQTPS